MIKVRKISLAILLLAAVSSSQAAYLKNVPQTIKQPNGEVIHCFASGDEYHNWLHDSAGFTIIQNPETGYYTYAIKVNGELTSSEYIVGKVNPAEKGLQTNINISPEAWAKQKHDIEMMAPKMPERKAGQRNHGHINNLVFYIRFSDESASIFNTSPSHATLVDRHNNTSPTANSMYNYYKETSYGKFSVTTTFYPQNSFTYCYQDIHPRSYYSNVPTNERASREHALLRRVVNFFKDSVPADLDLDFDGDGRVDNVCFITSGDPEGWSSLLWPHRWSLYTSPAVYIHGKRVYDYNFIMHSYTSIGVLTHEFMHTLGAPDFYRYDTYAVTPLGNWDVMASTNYNKPQGMGAYIKYEYGNWIDSLITITKPGTYTLFPANGAYSDKIGYKIPIEGNDKQFFVLEYRSRAASMFEDNASIPGSGILIYRIDTRFDGNGDYDGSTYFDEVYVFRPGGSTTANGTLSSAYYNSAVKRIAFDSTTNPRPFLTDGSYYNEIAISNITNAGDSIQFTIGMDTSFLDIDKSKITLDAYAAETDSFLVTSNVDWQISGDTSWLSVSPAEGFGEQYVYLTTKTNNDVTVAREAELTVFSTSKRKTVTVVQSTLVFDSCNIYTNQLPKDTLMLHTADGSFYQASEYFGLQAGKELQIDSVSIYFGQISMNNMEGEMEIIVANATSGKNPSYSSLHKETIQYKDIVPNSWNTFALPSSVKTSGHFCIYYTLPRSFSAGEKIEVAFLKNSIERKEYNMTASLRTSSSWRKPTIYFSDDNAYYSLAIKAFICPDGTGIETFTAKENSFVKIYPNPVKEQLFVEISDKNSSSANIMIYNVNGQLVSAKKDVNASEVNKINIQGLSSGVYFIQVTSDKFSEVKRFVVE